MGQLAPRDVIEFVKEQEPRFLKMNEANGALLDFEQECLFARQQLLKNKFTLKVAGENPNSLQGAILNVAAIGISLNPAQQHAYLVPRDGAICLDISFRGLVALAVDAGVIRWAKAELVYTNDQFTWNGPAAAPTHQADPFSDRGEIKGGYCIAMLPDGTSMVEVMSIEEIHKIRDTSKAYQKNGGPWKDWFEEMAKKTIIKRASKSWPQTGKRRRFDVAVDVLHQTEGTAYTLEEHAEFMALVHDKDALGYYRFRHSVAEQTYNALYNSFEKGQKTALKKVCNELEMEGNRLFREYKGQIEDYMAKDDRAAVAELLEEMGDENRAFVLSHLPAAVSQQLEDAA